jgi:transcriptional/translational regulatory protein YebC/TACO1
MSGHSKWSQIKRQKGASDGARSRAFSKLGQFIALESKKAAGNLSSPGLIAAIARAKAANMPKDTIDRAVAKGASKEASNLEQVVYEFYGPGGVAIIVDALTDNKNRTTQEIKHLITKNGFELGAQGSAQWAFTKSSDSSRSGFLLPNEPLMDVAGEDEEKLGEILSLFDDQEDVQQIFTNARGYERAGDESEENLTGGVTK